MLIIDNQTAQARRGDAIDQDARSRTIAQKRLVRHQVLRRALALDLVARLAEHQRLGLREEVAGQHALVQVALDGIVAVDGEQKVRGDQLGALVHELEEGVLCVGAGLAEEDRARRVIDVFAIARYGFAIGFHGELLQVRGEAVHVLVEAERSVRYFGG